MVIISAVSSSVFTLWSLYDWKVGRVSIRSLVIERKSQPSNYRIAMIGYWIIDSGFWVLLIRSCYVLFKPAA
jgi:hypothetical protein